MPQESSATQQAPVYTPKKDPVEAMPDSFQINVHGHKYDCKAVAQYGGPIYVHVMRNQFDRLTTVRRNADGRYAVKWQSQYVPTSMLVMLGIVSDRVKEFIDGPDPQPMNQEVNGEPKKGKKK